ncbi:MAG TPA: polysaccharide deacetylase family protein [Beijerinckiaceae bacterium]|jgi:peptidoglycan/xylan/chitin deacetylase (PgdA/CDA1 family)|nr:polysaccharide deacetylase family protein [Beijerinckiaceae bacterium]
MAKRPRYPREWSWPGQEKIAFSIGVPFEAFEKQSQVNFVASRGQLDRFSLSYGDYGWKAGIWRIMNILDEFCLKSSISANGLAAERHPDIIRTFAQDGHEVLGHGWANDVYAKDATADQERAEIARCTAILTETTGGIRPVGWTSPGSSGSDVTNELLAEQGYIWVGDDASDDLPFVQQTKSGPFVTLPRTNIFTNDIAAWIFPSNPTSVFLENFKETFDQLYREGQEGAPKWLSITLHSHMAGRPTMANTIRRCLDYVRQHDGVYYTRSRDIAEWALKREKEAGRLTAG